MDVSLQMTITIDGTVNDLLSMRPSEILPILQKFGEMGGIISEAIEQANTVPETDRDEKWTLAFRSMDLQLAHVATACQMCNLAWNRARFYNPDPDEVPAENSGDANE